jgi:hypothetical protein
MGLAMASAGVGWLAIHGVLALMMMNTITPAKAAGECLSGTPMATATVGLAASSYCLQLVAALGETGLC